MIPFFGRKLLSKSLHPFRGKRFVSVVIGCSGGVDSAVSAYLLKQQGYDVKAVFMKNWSIEEEKGVSVCPSKDDCLDAERIADFLKIPFEIVNFEKEYWTDVFEECLSLYQQGDTPNPDVLCNRHIKFDAFANKYLKEGYDFVATGHYCGINRSSPQSHFSSSPELLRGSDSKKDQSYFLSQISGSLLSHVLFPLADFEKQDVKQLARTIGLHVSDKKESMGICFIGERNMRNFLSQYLSTEEGDIVTIDGKRLGKHEGLMYYTIGQKMHIPNQLTKYYVCEKKKDSNLIVVCEKTHPALYSSSVTVDGKDLSLLYPNCLERLVSSSQNEDCYPFQCQLRYQTMAYPCRIQSVKENGDIVLRSAIPMRAVTPGQICVLYDKSVCLGGGRIKRDLSTEKVVFSESLG